MLAVRVVHLCRSFSPLSETFIYDYVTELERQGVDSRVLALGRVNKEGRPFERVEVVPFPSKWNVRRIGNWMRKKLPGRFQEPTVWSIVRPRLKRTLETMAPNVIHAHFGPCGVLIEPVARALGIPLVVSFYGYDISMLVREAYWREVYRELWKSANTVVVLSEEMKRAACALGCPKGKLHVVHLGRNLNTFAYHVPEGRVREFVSVGRLAGKKGHFDAVAAIGRVRKGGHDVRLRIIGDGPLRNGLAGEIDRHGLEEAVELVGALPNERVADELRAADAFLLCSKTAANGDREGTPTVLIEAQASGLPCVSTHHAGIPEVLPEANQWLLAEEGDVGGLAARIERLMESTPEALQTVAEAGRIWMEAEFNLKCETQKLHVLYRSTCHAEKTGGA